MADTQEQNTHTGQGAQSTSQSAAGALAAGVDVQAEVQKALAAARAADAEAFKKATGHDSLEAWQAAQMKEQGKTAELLALREQELAAVTAAHRESAVSAAILAAAGEAIDPAVVQSLLAAKAEFDAKSGAVTIHGKSPKDAVTTLLKDKPFLAKPAGPAGSGAPQFAGHVARNPWAKESLNLTEQARVSRDNPALAAQLKAAAGV